MDLDKSTRHQKIIGDCGENIVLNWLSRSGFETCRVDHTGIDIIASHSSTGKRLGISVKSRTRQPGKERDCINLLVHGKNDRGKLLSACHAFGCEPYIAVYVETSDFADLYLTSLANYDAKYRSAQGPALDVWKMGKKQIDQYQRDPEVKHVHMTFGIAKWHWAPE